MAHFIDLFNDWSADNLVNTIDGQSDHTPIQSTPCRHKVDRAKCEACDLFRSGMSETPPKEAFTEMANLLLEMGIPKRYANYDLDNFMGITDNKKTMKEAINYYLNNLLDKGLNLIISGYHETGKTHLAVGIIKYLYLNTSYSIKFCKPHELLEKIYLERIKANEYLASVDFLVLDGLGLIELNEYAKKTFLSILYDRWEKQKSVIITTTYSVDELKSFLGEHFFSIIIDNNLFLNSSK